MHCHQVMYLLQNPRIGRICIIRTRTEERKHASAHIQRARAWVWVRAEQRTHAFTNLYDSRVSWGNSDQNFKISFCFYLLSFISRCEGVILGPHLDQSVLYQLMKESPKKHVLRKSNNQNTKSSVELIRITPCGVIRINL
jgi:hypothetical protein